MKYKIYHKVLFAGLVVAGQSLMFTEPTQAAIFKCVNSKGATFYNDKPCPKVDEETQLQAVKDPVGGYIPPEFVPEKEEKKSVGVLVGKVPGKELDQSKKDKSDQSTLSSNGSNNNGSNTGGADKGEADKGEADQTANSSGSLDVEKNSMNTSDNNSFEKLQAQMNVLDVESSAPTN